jgi:aminomethyltransferase
MNSVSQLKRTKLNQIHKQLGAKMAEFGGWEMPIEYSGIIHEHLAVRNSAGLFDISHMGEIIIRGPESLELLQKVTCNDVSRLRDGQVQYSALLFPNGTFVDDILVHRLSPDDYFVCVNASNTDKDLKWICEHNDFDTEVEDVSDQYTQLAIQGPQAGHILQKLVNIDLTAIRYYWFQRENVDGVESIISRTGYTGEDGFEIYFPPESSEHIWTHLLERGTAEGLLPVGLGARNTLRLEAKMALYGHEISEKITPWEADLAWIVKMEKGDFIGRAALLQQQQHGIDKKLVGFEVEGKGIAREGYAVFIDGHCVGRVTSGGPAPYLKKNLGLAYVPVTHAQVGTPLDIEIRTNLVRARIVETPFYRRKIMRRTSS